MAESQDQMSPPGSVYEIEGKPVRFVARSSMGERLVALRAELLSLADRRQASNGRVFGSVARSDDHPGSDVDLLVGLAAGASSPPTALIEAPGAVCDSGLSAGGRGGGRAG